MYTGGAGEKELPMLEGDRLKEHRKMNKNNGSPSGPALPHQCKTLNKGKLQQPIRILKT